MTDTPQLSMRVERVLASANDEAARFHNEYIGTEHVLLALTADREGVAVTALQNLGVSLDDLRSRIETVIKPGPPDARPLAIRPYTTRTKHALELAASAARSMGHSYLGTEHLLLGLLDEAMNIAAQILASVGVRSDRARAEIERILGPQLHE